MARHAQTVREIKEEHPFHAAFMLGEVVSQAKKYCGCRKVKCELCGIAALLKRAQKIEHHSKIAHGYLTGGKSINPPNALTLQQLRIVWSGKVFNV